MEGGMESPVSVRLMSVVWQTACPSHTAKLVLLALADNANDEGHCWPSISTIAQKTNLTRQAVMDQIALLSGSDRAKQRHGKISESHNGQCFLNVLETGKGLGNKYQLLVKPVYQSSPLTSQPALPVVVKPVDYHQSSPLTGPVKPVDPNHQQPSVEPSVEPSRKVVGEKRSSLKGSTVIPAELNTPEFRATWDVWLDHLRQKRKSPSLHAQDLQLRKLATMGLVRAIDTINHCIEHNWQGIYELNHANNQVHRRHNPRNDGIAIGPTDYGEAAKRKLERQALEARNREASEAQGT